MYDEVEDKGYKIKDIKIKKMEKRYMRKVVKDKKGEMKGKIVIDKENRLWYMVIDNGKEMSYGVGIGREGFEW